MVKRVRPDVVLVAIALVVVHCAMMARVLAWLSLLAPMLLVWLVRPHGARADDARNVQLLLPAQPDRAAREVAARLRGELSAAGFTVVTESLATATTPREAMDANVPPDETMVVIFVRSSDGATIDAWISERILGSIAHERLSIPSGEVDAPRRLAVQVAELLRGRVAESALNKTALSEQPVQAEATHVPIATRAPQRRLQWAPSVGALLLWRPHDWRLSPMPTLAVAVLAPVVRPSLPALSLGGAVTLAALGPQIQRRSTDGSAVAHQGLAVAEALVHAPAAAWLATELAAGLGVYGVGVQGRARAPFVAHERATFSSLLAARLAADAKLSQRFSLRFSGQLLFAPQETSLRIADEEVARTGGAMVAGTVELRLWL